MMMMQTAAMRSRQGAKVAVERMLLLQKQQPRRPAAAVAVASSCQQLLFSTTTTKTNSTSDCCGAALLKKTSKKVMKKQQAKIAELGGGGSGSSSTNSALSSAATSTTTNTTQSRSLSTAAIIVEDYESDNDDSSSFPPTSTTTTTTTTDLQVYYETQLSTGLSESFRIPLTVADLHLRQEQLPFAYFFEETLDAKLLEESLQMTIQQQYPICGGHLDTHEYCTIDCHPTDTVRVSYATWNDMTLEQWKSVPRNHYHQAAAVAKTTTKTKVSSPKPHQPTLLPIFDPLFRNSHDESNASTTTTPSNPLLTVRVTYLGDGSTCLGINMLHMLGDTSTCVQFVESWARNMRTLQGLLLGSNDEADDVVKPCSFNRAMVSTTGMMTPDLAELMGLITPPPSTFYSNSWFSWTLPSWWSQAESDNEDDEGDESKTETLSSSPTTFLQHEYVQLHFPKSILKVMKIHGTQSCATAAAKSTFVSTNDMVTAAGWMYQRMLSGHFDWNMSVVVNIRGRVSTEAVLFGNGITNVIAEMEASSSDNTNTTRLDLSQISQAAQSIRQALTNGIEQLSERLTQSRLGLPSTNTSTTRSTTATTGLFSTTSWGTFFKNNKIQFGNKNTAHMAAFHGQPSHPLAPGCRTFESVIHTHAQTGDITYELFMPSDQVQQAKDVHQALCQQYQEWAAAAEQQQEPQPPQQQQQEE